MLQGTFLTNKDYDILVNEDADGYDLNGNMLFRFRKGAIPFDILKNGYESFKSSILPNEGRGIASGGSYRRTKEDGTLSNTTVGYTVESGLVGFMDRGEGGRNRFCRKTAFTKSYFDKFKNGIPFVEHVDGLYKELCPTHHEKQLAVARATNKNYRIADTSFTTVTVNKNFQTAVHQDAGDFIEGFGNLCVYREGNYEGAYLVLPEYRVAVNLTNTDMLFMDVHRWHGNTPFENQSEDFLRVAFVMYYRNNMLKCKGPAEELKEVQNYTGNFLRL